MLRHKREMHQPRKHCPYCEYDVPRLQRLQDHLREDHGIEGLDNYGSDLKESTEMVIEDLRRMQADSTPGAPASALPSSTTSSVGYVPGMTSYSPRYPILGHYATINTLHDDAAVSSGLPSRPPSSYSGNGQWKDDANATYPHLSYGHAQPTITQGYSFQPTSSSSTYNGFAPDATRHPLGTLAASDSVSGSAHSQPHQVLSSFEHPGYGSRDMAHMQYLPSENVVLGVGYLEASGDTSRGSHDNPFMPLPDVAEEGHDTIWDKYLE